MRSPDGSSPLMTRATLPGPRPLEALISASESSSKLTSLVTLFCTTLTRPESTYEDAIIITVLVKCMREADSKRHSKDDPDLQVVTEGDIVSNLKKMVDETTGAFTDTVGEWCTKAKNLFLKLGEEQVRGQDETQKKPRLQYRTESGSKQWDPCKPLWSLASLPQSPIFLFPPKEQTLPPWYPPYQTNPVPSGSHSHAQIGGPFVFPPQQQSLPSLYSPYPVYPPYPTNPVPSSSVKTASVPKTDKPPPLLYTRIDKELEEYLTQANYYPIELDLERAKPWQQRMAEELKIPESEIKADEYVKYIRSKTSIEYRKPDALTLAIAKEVKEWNKNYVTPTFDPKVDPWKDYGPEFPRDQYGLPFTFKKSTLDKLCEGAKKFEVESEYAKKLLEREYPTPGPYTFEGKPAEVMQDEYGLPMRIDRSKLMLDPNINKNTST